ncbi:hypothetical protein ACO0RG_001693 [Hanseniaspora osmophila]
MLAPFAGIRNDIKDKLPEYKSDWLDAWDYRVIPSVLETYFSTLLPALAFSQDLFNRTQTYGVNEILLGQGMAGIVFGIMGYPLTIVGITAPVSIFNYTTYDIFKVTYYEKYKDMSYLGFMFWVYLWSGIMHFLVAVFNGVTLLRFVSNFPCDIFGFFINVVYIVKGCVLLGLTFNKNETATDVADGFANVTIALCMAVFGTLVKSIVHTTFFNHKIRVIISDYSTVLSVIFWSGVIHFGNAFSKVSFAKLPITKAFYPTANSQTWLAYYKITTGQVFLALPFGIILTILFYFDHNVSSLMAQRTQYKLKKSSTFHFDFFLLGATTIVAGVLGVPAPNGLIPQAPLHTESLLVWQNKRYQPLKESDKDVEKVLTSASDYQTASMGDAEQKNISVGDPSNTAEQELLSDNGELEPEVESDLYVERCVEQRFTNTFQGIMSIITMCRPFLICLNQIPQCVLSGLFFIMGINGLLNNTITHRICFIVSDKKTGPLTNIPLKKLVLFVGSCLCFAAAEVGISNSRGAIGFPLILLLTVVFTFSFPKFLNEKEMSILDPIVASPHTLKNLLPKNLKQEKNFRIFSNSKL